VLTGAREVLAMVDEDEKQNNRSCSSAPSLAFSNIKTEYDRLCEQHGGPAHLGFDVSESDFRRCCGEYPLRKIVPVLLQFNTDESVVRRLWPWAAFAINQYVSENTERERYTDEPTPKEVEALVSEIAQSAHSLNSSLCKLGKFSNRLKDASAPRRRAHLAWLDAFISQAVANVLSNEVITKPEVLAYVQEAKLNFIKLLAMIEGTAKVAIKRVDKKLLDRERGQAIAGISEFVFRCGGIWKHLTGRTPSANKVTREGSKDPDFVVFVQELAKTAGAPAPTRRQVEKAL
jgi:hypothetical protein